MKHRRVLPVICAAFLAAVLLWSYAAYAADAKRLFNEGQALQKAGKLKEALKAYNQCLIIDPSNYDAMFAGGLAHFDLKEYAKAARMFEGVLAFQGEDVRVRLYLAESWDRLGRVGKAKNEYRRILEYSPDNVSALIGLGRAEFMSGNRFAAVETFKKASKLQPSNKSLQVSIERLENANLEYLKLSEELRRRAVISAVNNAIAEDAAEQERLKDEAAARRQIDQKGVERSTVEQMGPGAPGDILGPVRSGREMGAGRRTRGEQDAAEE